MVVNSSNRNSQNIILACKVFSEIHSFYYSSLAIELSSATYS